MRNCEHLQPYPEELISLINEQFLEIDKKKVNNQIEVVKGYKWLPEKKYKWLFKVEKMPNLPPNNINVN